MKDETANVIAVTGSIIAVILAAAAVVLAVVVLELQIGDIQKSRQTSATDTCTAFRRTVLFAAGQSGNISEGEKFLVRVGFKNCAAYGREVRNGTLKQR